MFRRRTSTVRTIQEATTPGQAAAAWWANALRAPKLDNGDTSEAGGITMMLGLLSQREPDPDCLDNFAQLLAANVDEQLKRAKKDRFVREYGITLAVDYHPDQLLATCGQQAKLDMGISSWPWKTTMWVKPNEISVSAGYRAETEVIWTQQS